MFRRIAPAAVALAIIASPAFAQTPITTCGQEVAGAATLPADLDCTGFVGSAVTIHGGTLAMNGHTITGSDTAVYCDRPCKIVGPGTLTGAKYFGVSAFGTKVKLLQVNATNNLVMGVQSWKNCVIKGPATISGNGIGVRGGSSVKAQNVTITGNIQNGIDVAQNHPTGSAIVMNSTITGNGSGVSAQRKVRVADSTITGNGIFGVSSGGFINGSDCVNSGLLLLKRSTVTGNDTDPSCGSTRVCADVVTCGATPGLTAGSTCDHSYLNESGNPGQTLNVCTLD